MAFGFIIFTPGVMDGIPSVVDFTDQTQISCQRYGSLLIIAGLTFQAISWSFRKKNQRRLKLLPYRLLGIVWLATSAIMIIVALFFIEWLKTHHVILWFWIALLGIIVIVGASLITLFIQRQVIISAKQEKILRNKIYQLENREKEFIKKIDHQKDQFLEALTSQLSDGIKELEKELEKKLVGKVEDATRRTLKGFPDIFTKALELIGQADKELIMVSFVLNFGEPHLCTDIKQMGLDNEFAMKNSLTAEFLETLNLSECQIEAKYDEKKGKGAFRRDVKSFGVQLDQIITDPRISVDILTAKNEGIEHRFFSPLQSSEDYLVYLSRENRL